MSAKKTFSFLERLASFRHAINGLRVMFLEEHNARIHLFATIVVLILGFYFRIDFAEWFAVLFSIGLVLSMELVNSSIEKICDEITKERKESIKKIKDLSAAAVLVSAIISAVVGLLIFVPKI